MTSSDHERYFANRERQCRTLAETHSDPFLRRIYLKFADNYARALTGKDHFRTPSQTEKSGSMTKSSESSPKHRRPVV